MAISQRRRPAVLALSQVQVAPLRRVRALLLCVGALSVGSLPDAIDHLIVDA